jgi:demethylmenaquinone methyltransferase/2-methoxy-6-polyprenyl-1,4-benzoquinol methylase
MASKEQVKATFARIARGYDLLNQIISLGQDKNWRRLSASLATSSDKGRALDLATGTGEMAFALAPHASQVIAVDFSPEMLQRARRKAERNKLGFKIDFLLADALILPFPDNSFDCASITFALRNVESITRCFAELGRVLKPGGCVVCLELVKPVTPVVSAFYRFYLYRVIPFIIHFLNRDRPDYIYLADSVMGFLSAEELKQVMVEAGLVQVSYRLLNLGTVAIHSGLKPGDEDVNIGHNDSLTDTIE